jgi:hypothetical protein
MHQNMSKRLSISIHEDVYSDILKISSKEERTINYIINSLLEKALKEKKRKRNGKKKVYSENNSSNKC